MHMWFLTCHEHVLLCCLAGTHVAHRLPLSMLPAPHPPQVRLADPTWVGFCHSRGIECGELPAGGHKAE